MGSKLDIVLCGNYNYKRITMDESLGNIIQPNWLAEEERLQKVDSIFDREPMSIINLKIIYVNTHDYIDKITCSSHSLTPSNNGSLIEKEVLIKLIQQFKLSNKTSKYKLLDVFLCNFDVNPSNIPMFSKNSNDSENATTYVKKISPVDDIFIPSSIFMFHDINTLYFIYQEYEIVKNNMPLKSILKQPSNSDIREHEQKKRHTKKVRISMKDNTHHESSNKRKTRRIRN